MQLVFDQERPDVLPIEKAKELVKIQKYLLEVSLLEFLHSDCDFLCVPSMIFHPNIREPIPREWLVVESLLLPNNPIVHEDIEDLVRRYTLQKGGL